MSGKKQFVIKEEIFESINSEFSAYYLGILYADGYNNGQYYITLELKTDDLKTIEIFRNKIYPCDKKPKISTRYFKDGKSSSRLVISSKKISSDLTKLGMIKCKSKTLKFPLFLKKSNYIKDFIRGYFDGDGTVFYSNKKRYVTFLGTYDFLNELQNVLFEQLKIKKTKIICANKKSSMLKFTISNSKDISCLLTFMYNCDNYYMERKKNIAMAILKDYSEGKIIGRENKSQHKGICFDNTRLKWVVYYNYKFYGRFDTELEAINKLNIIKHEKISKN